MTSSLKKTKQIKDELFDVDVTPQFHFFPPTMNKDEVLSARVPVGTKAALTLLAQRSKKKLPAFLNMLYEAVLESESVKVEPTAVVPGPHKMKRLEYLLPDFLEKPARQRAEQLDFKLAGWVSYMVQAAVMREPVLTNKELEAVRESNRELAAVGRNLNQIARAINEEVASGRKLTASGLLRLQSLQEVNASVAELREKIDQLVIARNRAWGNEQD